MPAGKIACELARKCARRENCTFGSKLGTILPQRARRRPLLDTRCHYKSMKPRTSGGVHPPPCDRGGASRKQRAPSPVHVHAHPNGPAAPPPADAPCSRSEELGGLRGPRRLAGGLVAHAPGRPRCAGTDGPPCHGSGGGLSMCSGKARCWRWPVGERRWPTGASARDAHWGRTLEEGAEQRGFGGPAVPPSVAVVLLAGGGEVLDREARCGHLAGARLTTPGPGAVLRPRPGGRSSCWWAASSGRR